MKKLSGKKPQDDLWMGTIKEVSKALAEKYAKEGFDKVFFGFAMGPDDDEEDLDTIYKNVSGWYGCCHTATKFEKAGWDLSFSYYGEGISTSGYIFKDERPDIEGISSEFERGICSALDITPDVQEKAHSLKEILHLLKNIKNGTESIENAIAWHEHHLEQELRHNNCFSSSNVKIIVDFV